MVAEGRVVPGETEDVAHAERVGGQEIGLDGQAVPVAARDLEHRLDARLEQSHRRGDGRLSENSRGHIGHVDRAPGVPQAFDHLGRQLQRSPAARGQHVGGAHKEAPRQLCH